MPPPDQTPLSFDHIPGHQLSQAPPEQTAMSAAPSADEEAMSQYQSPVVATGVAIGHHVWNAIKEGIPTFNDRFAAATAPYKEPEKYKDVLPSGEAVPKMQLVHPEAAMTKEEQARHPMISALAEEAGGMTSPANVAIMAGTAGFGELPGAAGKLIPKLVSLGFSAQSLYGAYQQIPAFRKALDAGNINEAENIFTHIVAGTAIGAYAGQHGTEGVGEHLAETGTSLYEGLRDELHQGIHATTPRGWESQAGRVPLEEKPTFEHIQGHEEVARPEHVMTTTVAPNDFISRISHPESHMRTDIMNDYLQKMQTAGGWPEDLSPVKLYLDEHGEVINGDGRHRAGAALQAGIDRIPVEVHRVLPKDAYHPDLQKMAERYGTTTNPEDIYTGAFVAPDGKYVNLGGVTHDDAILGVRQQEPGKEDPRISFIRDANAIRLRLSTERAGETAHMSVPKSGVTPEQVDALKKVISNNMSGGRGNIAMEIGEPGGKYAREEFVTANRIEPMLREIGAHPEQKTAPPEEQEITVAKEYPGETGYDETLIPSYYRTEEGGRYSPRKITYHEAGHAVIGEKMGLPAVELRSGLHSENKKGTAAASAHFDLSGIPGLNYKTRQGKWSFESGSLNAELVHKIGTMMMGGGVADEIINGVPIEANDGMSGDNRMLDRLFNELGIPRADRDIMRQSFIDQAKNLLTEGDTLDKMKQHLESRVEGTPDTLLMSHEHVRKMMADIKGETDYEYQRPKRGTIPGLTTARKPRTLAPVVGGGGAGDVAGTEGEIAARFAREGEPKPEVTEEEHWSEKAAKASEAGGFIIDPRTGETPTKGYPINILPEANETLDHNATAEDIRNFHAKNRALFESHPELVVGGYGKELNISAVAPTKAGAEALGRRLDQKSIWDVEKQKEIETGGKGERLKFADYPLESRLADMHRTMPEGFEHLTGDVYDHLEPDEREYLRDNKLRQKKLVQTLGGDAPHLHDELMEAMKVGGPLGGWWQRYMDTFEALGKGKTPENAPSHPEALKAWHAALSGNKSVEYANHLAWGTYKEWLKQGRPTDRASIDKIIKQYGADPSRPGEGVAAISDTLGKRGKIIHKGLDTTKLSSLVNSPEMRGERPFPGTVLDPEHPSPVAGVSPGALKIPSMAATVAGEGNLNRLVIDAHIKDFFGQNGLTHLTYLGDSVRLRKAARELGLRPGEGQEQLWGTVLGIKQLLLEGLPTEEVTKRLTPELISGIGKDYAEVIKNDPELATIFEELKSYGLDPGGKRAQARLDEIIASRPQPSPQDINQAVLANTVERIKGQLAPRTLERAAGKAATSAAETTPSPARVKAKTPKGAVSALSFLGAFGKK